MLSRNILLIDPDATMACWLENAGYIVTQVGTTEAASAHIPTCDLIIVELDLPDDDGVLLVSDLRARRAVPIMVCTNRNSHERTLALKFGADMAVEKPLDARELIERVNA